MQAVQGDHPPSTRRSTLVLSLALASVYFTAGKLGLSLAFVHVSASAVWPPTGIGLAALMLLGYRVWPGLLLGAYAVNITTAGSAVSSAGIAIGNTLEGLMGAWLVNRYIGGRQVFDSAANVFKFAALGGVLATAVSPSIGVTSLVASGLASWSAYGRIWRTWWLGDATGALVVAPVILLWAARPRPGWSRNERIELSCFVVTLVFTGLFAFSGFAPGSPYFLCVPVLLWAVFRFGQREAATATLLLAILAVMATLLSRERGGPNESLLLLQSFMAMMSVTMISVGAVVADRRRAEEALEQVQQAEAEIRRLNVELEQRVVERTAELERSNEDLKQFAYVTSHDLQEPLRMVRSYCQQLERRYADRLDEDAHRFIGHAVDGAERMHELVRGLLEYSRVGTREMAIELVDCEELVRQVLGDLVTHVEEGGVRVRVDRLPTLAANPALLRQVLQNLLSNAIKYRREDRPEVHLSARRENDEWVVCVRDNGIGFDPRHAARIFAMFQRLHTRREYTGTGMGLAICKKAVERHGGRIWVETEPGVGSAFYFSVPAGGGDGA